MGGLEETDRGHVMGTGLGLLVRDRKTESRDTEVGPRDLGTGDGWISALTQASQRELGPAIPAHVSYQPGDLNF